MHGRESINDVHFVENRLRRRMARVEDGALCTKADGNNHIYRADITDVYVFNL